MTSLLLRRSGILSKFYIKPQRVAREGYPQAVVSYRNSTSNHNPAQSILAPRSVVSYRNSTSNHNHPATGNEPRLVVSYRNSTSNHNPIGDHTTAPSLYLIEILHQTTTTAPPFQNRKVLYLIEILHQTTTLAGLARVTFCCILSKFYIKPQPERRSTFLRRGCILSKFYIKPQPGPADLFTIGSCILSKFYIKPQRMASEGYS